MCRVGVLLWFVDPDGAGKCWRLGRSAHEPFGVCGVGGVEDDPAPLAYGFGSPVVNVGGGVEANAGVTVLVVVPAKEAGAVGLGVFETAEAVGEGGPVLQRPELALGVGVP